MNYLKKDLLTINRLKELNPRGGALMALIFLILGLSSPQVSAAKVDVSYITVASKDLDQMNELVLEKIRASKKISEDLGEGAKLEPLKEALALVFARPNEDNTVEKVVTLLRNPLDEFSAWESSFDQMVDDSIATLKEPIEKDAKLAGQVAAQITAQVTATIILENVISEFKPEAKKKPESFEYRILERISKSEIEVSKQCKNERKLRQMKGTTSPSTIARTIIDDIAKRAAQQAADEAEAAKLAKSKSTKESSSNSEASKADSGEKAP